MAVPHAGYATPYAALLHAGYAARNVSPIYAGYVALNAALPHAGHTAFYVAPPASVQTWAPSSPKEWVFDSGATGHLSKDADILDSLSSHPVYHYVTVGDGFSVPVSSSGHASLPSVLSNHPLHLRNVLVTPRIIKNLISIHQFTTDNNCSVDFDPFGFSVRDLFSRHELLRCNSTRELYSF
jgi:hypothetical protein